MSTASAVLFSVAFGFYVLTWVYIRQLVQDVNTHRTEAHVSILRWHKGWKRHRALFPSSPVRSKVLTCVFLTVAFGLIAFGIEARQMFLRLH